MNVWLEMLENGVLLDENKQTVLETDEGDVVIIFYDEETQSALTVEYHPCNSPSVHMYAEKIAKEELIAETQRSFAGYFIMRNSLGIPEDGDYVAERAAD